MGTSWVPGRGAAPGPVTVPAGLSPMVCVTGGTLLAGVPCEVLDFLKMAGATWSASVRTTPVGVPVLPVVGSSNAWKMLTVWTLA